MRDAFHNQDVRYLYKALNTTATDFENEIITIRSKGHISQDTWTRNSPNYYGHISTRFARTTRRSNE